MDVFNRSIFAAAAVCATSVCAANDLIAVEIPGIPGDANFAASHGLPQDSIEVFSVVGGFSQVLNIGSQSTGVSAGKVTFNPLTISKHFGASSPAILLATAQGLVYDSKNPVLISFYHVDHGGAAHKYFSIQLSTAAIQSVQLSDSEIRPNVDDLESVSFDYGVITITDLTTGSSSCWNRIHNSQC